LNSANTIRAFGIWICVVGSLSVSAQSSILSNGSWYKVSIEKNGVYKITFDQFKKMGFDPDKTDPRKIKIAGNIGGMLPQPNSTLRPDDLTENAIFVSGENDGVFNKEDFILFYAEGSDGIRFNATKKITAYEHNLYSDKNFYFITVSSDNGKRIATTENLGTGFPIVNTFNDFTFHELDDYSELKSGREWYGERFDLTTDQIFKIDISGITNNTTMTWVSDVMAQSFNGSSFKLFFNNKEVGTQTVATIPNSTYGAKGRHKRDSISFNSGTVLASSTTSQEIKYQYTKAGSGKSVGFLDFFLISFIRDLSLYGDQTLFRSALSVNQPTSQFEIANASTNCTIWNITDPANATQQSFSLQNTTAVFSTTTNAIKEYIIFNNNVPSPTLVGKIENQNLHSFATPNLIIVTHPDFKTEALRLAEHRQSHSGMTALVVTKDEVYNEFSSGRQDPTAIRDFAKYLYDKNPSTLKSLLIFGRGSYDYKDHIAQNNTNFVPAYESRNSLAPLETYSSDDYYGFMEDNEGNWGESPAQNHTMDIGVGRLPVKSAQEASDVVDKIISYDTNKKAFGSWRKEISFVADDGSTSDGFSSTHQAQANSLANQIESTNPAFNTKRTFLGTYTKTVSPSGETIPKVNEDIKARFNKGSIIINYTGHGNENLWADERVFTETDIDELGNTLYPFLVTATCEFGRQDDPAQISSAELTLLRAKGGAIGLVTTARPVNSSTNFDLNQAFYEALLQKESNQYLTSGEIFRRTKNNSTSGVSNRNFSLLADPSLTLALPTNNVVVTELKTISGSDTLKALSRVKVKGEVQGEMGALLSSFNGTLEATLFDKETQFVTIGKNNPPYSYKEWFSAIFRGRADVHNGVFEFEFILPKNMAYEVGKGKLSLYAEDPSQGIDAAGATTDFSIGGSEPSPTIDTTTPTLQAFIGDTTFVNGGITNPNTTLLVHLKDAGGINISGYGIGNNLMATLDDNETFNLNDYYIAESNDFTKGWINYPLNNLSPGAHTITIKAWDTSNNGNETTVQFWVTDGEEIVIEQFGNYPNPLDDQTTFFFTHNRSGDELEIELHLFAVTGQQLKTYEMTEISSSYQVNFPKLDCVAEFGKKLPPGLYLARLGVRSLSNGSKCERVTKLIVVN
jgi:hypothetical protein